MQYLERKRSFAIRDYIDADASAITRIEQQCAQGELGLVMLSKDSGSARASTFQPCRVLVAVDESDEGARFCALL